MRLAPLAIALVCAGCVNVPGADTDAGSTVDDTILPVEPFSAEGEVFLPPSQSNDPEETSIPFPVNASGSALVADFVLGSRYGPLDAPPVVSEVVVQIRAPDGAVLGEATIRVDAPRAHVEAEANDTGEYALALLSYGGSDGQANGDYVGWHVAATPPSSTP